MAVKQRFMLDTNVVRVLLERRSPQLDQWFAEERCSLSAIVAAEIRFGLARQTLSKHRASLVADLLDVPPSEPFDVTGLNDLWPVARRPQSRRAPPVRSPGHCLLGRAPRGAASRPEHEWCER